MQIDYENPKVEKIFNDFNEMKKKIGNDLVIIIKKRLNQLSAAEDFSSYLSLRLGKPHPLDHDLKGYFAISLTGNIRLIVRPDTTSLDKDKLKECKTVYIKGVVDYHGKKNKWFIS